MYFAVLLTGFVFQWFNKRTLFWIFASILALMAFIRYGTGLDYFTYEFLYDQLRYSVIDEINYGTAQQEIGFRVIGSLLKGMGFNYQLYLIVFSGISLFFIIKTCRKYCQNPTLALLIFFCFYYMTWIFSAFRQGIVLSVGLYFLLRSIEKKSAKSLIIAVLLLTLIHTSALMLLVLYFLSKIDFKKKTLLILSALGIIWSMIPIGVIIAKFSWLPFYERLEPYLDTSLSLNIPDFSAFGRIAFLVVAFYFYDRYAEQGDTHEKVINVYIVSLIIYFLLQFSELTAARLSIYGKILDIIILSNLLYIYRKTLHRLLYMCGLFALCFVYLFKGGNELERGFGKIDSDPVFTPYVNIFNKDSFYFKSDYYDLAKKQ